MRGSIWEMKKGGVGGQRWAGRLPSEIDALIRASNGPHATHSKH